MNRIGMYQVSYDQLLRATANAQAITLPDGAKLLSVSLHPRNRSIRLYASHGVNLGAWTWEGIASVCHVQGTVWAVHVDPLLGVVVTVQSDAFEPVNEGGDIPYESPPASRAPLTDEQWDRIDRVLDAFDPFDYVGMTYGRKDEGK